MKTINVLTGIIFIFNLTLINAQTEQGKVLLGISSGLNLGGGGVNLMNIQFSNTKQKSDANGNQGLAPTKSTGFNFLPRIGFFVANNFAIGLDLDILYDKEDGGIQYKSSDLLYLAGPFVRYYIPTASVKPFFEVKGSYGVENSKMTFSNQETSTKMGISMVSGGVGLATPLGKKVNFDTILGYSSEVLKDKKNNPNNLRSITGSFSISLGFTVLLGAG